MLDCITLVTYMTHAFTLITATAFVLSISICTLFAFCQPTQMRAIIAPISLVEHVTITNCIIENDGGRKLLSPYTGAATDHDTHL